MTLAVNLAQGASNNVSFRNRIINGAMVIDQRNAGAAVTATGVYALDRYIPHENTDGAYTVQQVTTAPAGFSYSMKATVTTADTSIGASQNALISQYIEGYNVSDLGYGTANAQTVTLSFWVNSAVTGTFSGSLQNSASDRSYPFSYTINSANTWEYETITIAGDTSGTWIGATNGVGLRVWFALAAGSSLVTTAGAWAAGTYYGATGQANWMATLGNTFYITGVQLEAGTTASPFEYRQYGTELQLCQRYYEKSYDIDAVPGSSTNNGLTKLISFVYGSVYYPGTIIFKQTKRAVPTMSFWSDAYTLGSWTFYSTSASAQVAVSGVNTGMSSSCLTGSGSTYSYCQGQWVASAEL
jgi:hypothetical protein